MQTDNALIVVDYQNGFIPVNEWGTWELWVEGGWLLSPKINELMRDTKRKWGLVIATRDWHPQGHMSFASNYEWKNPFEAVTYDEAMNGFPQKLTIKESADFTDEDLVRETWAAWDQMLWPDHCVAGTESAQYFKDLDTSLIDRHIIKGYDPTMEMYSWFFGKEDNEKWEKLIEILRKLWVESVRVVWLATDYCIRSTAADAVKNGFKTVIDSSAIRWVAVPPEDTIKYLETLREREGVDFE